MATTAGIATLGGGYLALGAAGQDEPLARAVAASSPVVSAQDRRRGLPAAAAAGLAGQGRRAGRRRCLDRRRDHGRSGLDRDRCGSEGAASSAVRARTRRAEAPTPSTRRSPWATVSRCRRSRRPRRSSRSSRPATESLARRTNGAADTASGRTRATTAPAPSPSHWPPRACCGPLASGPLMSWGEPGKGKWVTICANDGHVFLEVAGIRFDTSAQRVTGSRWINEMRSTAGFVARHPAGL